VQWAAIHLEDSVLDPEAHLVAQEVEQVQLQVQGSDKLVEMIQMGIEAETYCPWHCIDAKRGKEFSFYTLYFHVGI